MLDKDVEAVARVSTQYLLSSRVSDVWCGLSDEEMYYFHTVLSDGDLL